jgi:xanthine dehydrogenase accessory factor
MAGPSAQDFVRRLAALVEGGQRVAVATVVDVTGSASARPGARAIIDAQGRLLFGWLGGGCVDTTACDEAMRALADGRPRLLRLDLDDEVLGVGMPCGGHMTVYVDPLIPRAKLLVVGHGRIAEALVRLEKLLDFHVTVNDPLAMSSAFADADLRVADDPDYAKLEADAETWVVITTQHKSDFEALQRVLEQESAWVGLVASASRAALLSERLAEAGVPGAARERVAAPCGLDLGAETPEEIAVSIIAEILQQRRGGASSGRRLAEVKGSGARARSGRAGAGRR